MLCLPLISFVDGFEIRSTSSRLAHRNRVLGGIKSLLSTSSVIPPSTSVTTSSSSTPSSILIPDQIVSTNTEAWKTLVPALFDTAGRTGPPKILDVHVRFGCPSSTTTEEGSSSCSSSEMVAKRLLAAVGMHHNHGWHDRKNHDDETMRLRDLSTSIRYFCEFCHTHLDIPVESLEFQARLVASLGRKGTKCPTLHVDHVPVRFLQAFYGPSVEYIANAPESVRWDRVNNLDDEDDTAMVARTDRNRQILRDDDIAIVQQPPTGQAILLFGNRWNEFVVASSSSSIGPIEYPAVHKSPHIVWPWQGRVLFTLDVIPPEPPVDA